MPNRLTGATILLLTSFLDEIEPEMERSWSEEEVRAHEEEAVRVEEAIVCLARSVFSEGGRLVFKDHPLVTPLIAQINAQYPIFKELEKPRSDDADGGSAVVFKSGYADSWTPESEILTNAGTIQRSEGIPESFDAVVCIGGRDADAVEWRRHFRDAPIYLISSTGGAAARISIGKSYDDEIVREIENRRAEMYFEGAKQEQRGEEEIAPELVYATYPLLMARLVDEIASK